MKSVVMCCCRLLHTVTVGPAWGFPVPTVLCIWFANLDTSEEQVHKDTITTVLHFMIQASYDRTHFDSLSPSEIKTTVTVITPQTWALHKHLFSFVPFPPIKGS